MNEVLAQPSTDPHVNGFFQELAADEEYWDYLETLEEVDDLEADYESYLEFLAGSVADFHLETNSREWDNTAFGDLA